MRDGIISGRCVGCLLFGYRHHVVAMKLTTQQDHTSDSIFFLHLHCQTSAGFECLFSKACQPNTPNQILPRLETGTEVAAGGAFAVRLSGIFAPLIVGLSELFQVHFSG